MKQIILTILFACAFPIAQASPTAFSNDTIFLFREVTDDYYHAIYVDGGPK